MEKQEFYLIDDFQGFNLRAFFGKLLRKWHWFAISLPVCLIVAFLYGKMVEPVYQTNTLLLIHEGEEARSVNENALLQGTVRLVEGQKNLKNEIGILSSFNLIKSAIDKLELEVSYHSKKWLGTYHREHYKFFPFTVEVHDSSYQIAGVPFEVELLPEGGFSLSLDTKDFTLYVPETQESRKIERGFQFARTFAFGEEVKHEFFHFTLHLSKDPASIRAFDGKSLEFVLHPINALADSYKKKLKIEPIDLEASILEIMSEGAVVQKEIDFLTALNETYINTKLREKSELASSTLSFIENQVNSVRDSLQQAERTLENFRRRNRAIDLNFSAQSALSQLETLESDKSILGIKDQYYQSLLSNLDDSKPIEQIVAPSGVGISDPVINQMVLELKDLNSEKLKLSYTAGEKSYDLQILEKQIASTRSSLKQNLQSLSSSTQLSLRDNNSRIRRVEGTLSRLPGNEKALVEIQRKYALNENLYNYLRQKLAEVEIAKAEKMADSKILDSPRMLGDRPISPQKSLLLMLAFFVALLVPTAIIVIQNPGSDVITDVQHLEKLSRLPIISSIAHQKNQQDTLISEEAEWQVMESFRDLSANLQFISPPHKSGVIGFTSTVEGEGKTFCSANLAKSLADAGLRVLLVDLDLRNPSLLRYLNRQDVKGLSDYLRGDVTYVNEIIYPLESDFLHFIPTAPVENNVHRWLNHERMQDLIMTLKDEYDYVILDMPPAGLVSDFLLLSQYIGMHFYVMRANYSKVEYVNSLKNMKQKGQLNRVYLILNDVKRQNFKYGYQNYSYRS